MGRNEIQSLLDVTGFEGSELRKRNSKSGRDHAEARLINRLGVTMGGFLAAATDSIMAYAITSVLESEQSFVTITLQTTYLRPVFPGIAARVERKGTKTTYLTAAIIQERKACCSAVSSMMIL